ncbi:MAG: DNA topoisomerase I [Candidatus Odinarchaeum yellowstonii]|uniref:DNA topoisomerase 1 n=1 Tax=Odinarchaeota yellowstonii (strain LCB_4) TaxID=1841599 RepID=A0AAF0D3J8_ODILC|nr:MAG: DNA topoisomerase I [Candidatus Odinarchaeum yellowstonii]
MSTLIITEKPSACLRIASALADDGGLKKFEENGVTYYRVKHNGEQLIVVPALGHLYTVTQRGEGWVYPVFNTTWAPSYKVSKSARNTKSFIEIIRKLASEANTFVNACDFDLEGSLIGYSIIKYSCGEHALKTAKRMKYSTLTKGELTAAFKNMPGSLDLNMVEAGQTRHEVDWLFGINLSRALTLALKNTSGMYRALSTGRVQGPTLSFLYHREKEIRSFVPIPYWVLNAEIELDGTKYQLEYSQSRIDVKAEAERILGGCIGKPAVIRDIKTTEYRQNPPVPFDIGSLQVEAYKLFGFTPRRTLNIAERLYLEALISYPRTSSQKIPESINVIEILKGMAQQPAYRKIAEEILSKDRIIPNQGEKEDPAHPAIHVTGNKPERELDADERRLYDLIAKRFFALFGEPALKESVKAEITIGDHIFYLKGRQVKELGWLRFYEPYFKQDDIILPPLSIGQSLPTPIINLDEKYTTPPPRYNPSSLLKLMEKENLGTKATRADIIETLIKRGFVTSQPMEMTDLGFSVIEVLEKYSPNVLSVKLTRDIEEDLELIQENKKTRKEVIIESINALKPILEEFKLKENVIGADLGAALKKLWKKQNYIGVCPKCGTGELTVIYSRSSYKRFIGCSNYRNGSCNASFPLPQKGRIESTDKKCEHCGYPIIKVFAPGRRPWNMCVNWLQCPGRKASGEAKKPVGG